MSGSTPKSPGSSGVLGSSIPVVSSQSVRPSPSVSTLEGQICGAYPSSVVIFSTPSSTVTVSGSEPVVVKVSLISSGKVVSSTSTVASPTGISGAIQVPSGPVVTVVILPSASVITTSTPGIPGSLGPCTPSPSKSSNTTPDKSPNKLTVKIAQNVSSTHTLLGWVTTTQYWLPSTAALPIISKEGFVSPVNAVPPFAGSPRNH